MSHTLLKSNEQFYFSKPGKQGINVKLNPFHLFKLPIDQGGLYSLLWGGILNRYLSYLPLVLPRLVLLYISVLLMGIIPSAWAQTEAPDVLLKRAVLEVAEAILADKDIQSDNRAKIVTLVENKVAPYIQFQRMTQSVMGKHWKRATPQQQEAMVIQFKALLIQTYAGALSTYRKETVIEYKPTRPPEDGQVVVRSIVKNPGRDPIQLDYYLESFDNTWKVIDINVAGFRVVDNFRNQFAPELNSNGIDAVLTRISERVKTLKTRGETKK